MDNLFPEVEAAFSENEKKKSTITFLSECIRENIFLGDKSKRGNCPIHTKVIKSNKISCEQSLLSNLDPEDVGSKSRVER